MRLFYSFQHSIRNHLESSCYFNILNNFHLFRLLKDICYEKKFKNADDIRK